MQCDKCNDQGNIKKQAYSIPRGFTKATRCMHVCAFFMLVFYVCVCERAALIRCWYKAQLGTHSALAPSPAYAHSLLFIQCLWLRVRCKHWNVQWYICPEQQSLNFNLAEKWTEIHVEWRILENANKAKRVSYFWMTENISPLCNKSLCKIMADQEQWCCTNRTAI